jgi:uncharacterized membrane protein
MWFLIAVCIVCWAVWAIVEKLATNHASPLMMQVISGYAYSVFAPMIFLYMKARNIPVVWTAKGICLTLTASLLATIASLAFTSAIQRAHVHLVVGLTSAYPILTFLLCAIFLSEPVTVFKLIGISLIVCGTIMLAW